MTVQELAEKTYAGSMCHPICQIERCYNDDLHDIVLTQDGGIYMLCNQHFREYMELSSAKWHREFQEGKRGK